MCGTLMRLQEGDKESNCGSGRDAVAWDPSSHPMNCAKYLEARKEGYLLNVTNLRVLCGPNCILCKEAVNILSTALRGPNSHF